jgi:hypothetical protein
MSVRRLIELAKSPTRSRFGPFSMEFQLNECFVGQLQKPSWCLVIKTMYLEVGKLVFTGFADPKPRKELLCAGRLEQISPIVGVVEFRLEHWRKIGIGETRPVVSGHEIDNVRFF